MDVWIIKVNYPINQAKTRMNSHMINTRFKALLLILAMTLVFSACGARKPPEKRGPLVMMKKSVAEKPQEDRRDVLAQKAAEDSPKSLKPEDEQAFTPLTPYQVAGEKGLVPVREPGLFSKEKMVSVAVDKMALPEFIHHVFSDVFDVNYVMESRLANVKEKVTLNLPKPVSEEQLYHVVVEVLEKSNVSVTPKEGIFYITAGTKGPQFSIGIGGSVRDIPSTSGMIQQIIPVRYASAGNLKGLIPPLGITSVRADKNQNILIATGPREGIEQVIHIANVLDRPSMRGKFVGMLKVKYWDLAEFTKKLSEPLTREGIPVAQRAGQDGLYFIPMPSQSKVLLFCSESDWIDRARYWAGILDVPPLQDKKEYFLYYPECSRAADLGESLEKILGLDGSRPARQTGPSEKTVSVQGGQTGSGKQAPKAAARGKELVVLQENMRMTVDENRNALIFYATPEKYQEVERLLRKLDVIPQQVLLEATIAEVTLTESFSLGVEWTLRNYTPEETGETGIFDLMAGGGGLTWGMLTRGAKFDLLLEALAQDSLVKILSSPNLTVRDGKSANIVVGKDVPILTQQATSDIQTEGSTGIVNAVQYRTTGINLAVTPTVHARGVVTLVINQSLTKAETTTSSKIDSPTILNRSVTTEVVVGDGQTVVLGGLIDEQGSEGESGVPYLRDIPILGYFFKSQNRSSDRTELIITITPRIIRHSWQIDEMKKAIVNGLELIQMEGNEQGAGSK